MSHETIKVPKTSKLIHKEFHLDNKIYKAIRPTGSKAGVMYGLPKVHKSGTPLRPIISAVGTYNYKPAKYLNSILAPLVQSPLIIKDTFDFVGRVRTMDKWQDKQWRHHGWTNWTLSP